MSPKVSTLAKVQDPLYVFDADARDYVPLDAERYAAIVEGKMRL